MSSKKTWFLVIAVVAFGFFVEGLKHWRASTTEMEASRVSRLSLVDMDVRPFHVSDSKTSLNHHRAGRRGMRLSAERDQFDSHDFGETHRMAQKAKVTKTEDKKKKKKKKKKRARGKKKDELVADADRPYYNESERQRIQDGGDSSTYSASNFEPDGDEPAPKELPLTYEDWAKLVLGSPNRAEVLRMTEFYRSNLITADVFYAILSAMTESGNETQQYLAVEAAGNVPSPMSFVFLLSALKNFAAGSAPTQAANERINDYHSLGNVGHLLPVLDNHVGDQLIAGHAMRVLDQSTDMHITRGNDRNPSDQGQGGPSRGGSQDLNDSDSEGSGGNSSRRLAQVFLPFDPVVERLGNAYAGSDVGQMAGRALERIRSLRTVVVAQPSQ